MQFISGKLLHCVIKFFLILSISFGSVFAVEQSCVDISRVQFDKSLTLDTGWVFYNATNQSEKVTLPLSLEVQTGEKFTTGVYKIKLVTNGRRDLAMRLGNQQTTYRIKVNGVVLDSNGDITNHSPSYIPKIKLSLVPLPIADTIVISIELSNYFFKMGGLINPIKIGIEDKLQANDDKSASLSLIFSGIILFMGMFHFFLYAIIRKEQVSLVFGIFCLFMSIRSIVVNPHVIELLLPNIDSYYIYLMTNISRYSSAVFGLFTYYVFPKHVPRKLAFSFIIVSSLFVIVNIIVDSKYMLDMVYFYHVVLIIQVVTVSYYYILALRKKVEGSVLYGASFILIFVSVLHDLAMNYFVFSSIQIVPYAVVLFLFSQSYALSKKFAKSFAHAENLSLNLLDKNEELNRLSKIKDEFLANTSHELRTPLHGIVGIAETVKNSLNERGESGPLIDNTNLIIQSARRLNRVVNDILDFSKLKNRDIKLDKTNFIANPIVENIVKVFSIMYAEKKFEIKSDIEDGLTVFGDDERFYQILYNVMGNSCKFTTVGHVKIEGKSNDGFAVFSIHDTGIGMDEKQISVVFDAFEQGENHETKVYGGTGLGLSITKSLVELHGGRIEVESIKDVGSKFTIYLPLGAGEIGESSIEEEVSVVPTQSKYVHDIPEECDILVVDDEYINLEIVKQHLAKDGYKVGVTTDPKSALALIRNLFKPKLLILDVMMPEISGYEVCTEVRKMYSTMELPIIMLTAKNRIEDLYKGFSCGANDYISKPFYSEELLSRVSTFSVLSESYRALLQNESLKKEIVSKEEGERELRESNEQINAILDTIENALLGVNDSGVICYYNESFQQLLSDESMKIIGVNAKELLPKFDITLSKFSCDNISLCKTHTPFDVTIQKLKLSKSSLNILLFREAEEQYVESEKLIETISSSNNKLEQISHFIENNNSNRSVVGDIAKSVDLIVDQLAKSEIIEKDIRMKGVSLMVNSITYWTKATNKTKQDFARESKLWRVQMNMNGWERTQTLDKYLTVASLPKNPKWMLLIKSVNFILNQCDEDSELRKDVVEQLKEFKILACL